MSSPILTAHLFPEVEDLLLSLLRSLTKEEWDLPTIVPNWKVRHVAAHLLDTQLRKLSIVRDGFTPNVHFDGDLIAFINRLNAEGVTFYSRLSPPVLTSLMETASCESCEFHKSLDPFAKAAFPVSWAGEEESLNWFDTAREFTERWHHQQQIRLAVNKPGLMQRHLYYPVLDCFMRALPYSYRDVQGETGSLMQIEVTGDCGGTWFLQRTETHWQLGTMEIAHPRSTQRDVEVALPQATHQEGANAATISIPQEIAWRIFTKGISRPDAISQSTLEGQRDLAEHFFSTLAIVG